MENIIASNQEGLADLCTHIISAKSTKNYNGALTFWIYLNCPNEICLQLQEVLDGHKLNYEESLVQLSLQDLTLEMRNSEISKLKAIYFRNQKKRIKAWFIQSAEKRNNTPPIELSHITADIVTSYLLGLRKLNGDPPWYSNYSTHRPSIRHLFRMYSVSAPAEFDSLMGLDFKSLKRKVANRVNDAGGNVQVGKSPIELSLYSFIA